MANERAFIMRNVGTEESPVWERWFVKTVFDAVLMSDADGETTNIKQYVDTQIANLVGSDVPETADTLAELYELISTHKDAQDLLNEAIANKADKDHGHNDATQEAAGFMSIADKKKLDGIEAGANNYVHPDVEHLPAGGTAGQILQKDADGNSVWATQEEISFDEATQEKSGLMSAADKIKLDGVEEGANKYVHPETHAATMITEDETHRFVSDEEKAAWDAKANIYVGSTAPATAPTGSICFLTSSATTV